MTRNRVRWILPAVLFTGVALLGCADSMGVRGTARLELAATSTTDGGPTVVQTETGPVIATAPDPGGSGDPVFASTILSISRIYLVPAGEGEEGVDLMNASPPIQVDLMNLGPDAEAMPIAEGAIPEGTYNQLRVVVDEATVRLADGLSFIDGTNAVTLKVPSGMESGIKVDLLGSILADGGSVTSMLMDLDVNENFVLEGNLNTAAGLKGVIFTPHLREERRDANPTPESE